MDALRGLFLLIMAAVHVPTPLSHLLQEPFGFTSVAEGFIFLSAYVSGRVYGKCHESKNWLAMSDRVWQRTRLISFLHLGLLVPFALLAWATEGHGLSLSNHFHDFLSRPVASLMFMPLLLHQPPLFDILPLYVVLLGVTPWLLALAKHFGWQPLVMISALGWLFAQTHFHIASETTGEIRLGAFNLPAWQFLWVAGLALGETSRRPSVLSPVSQGRLGVLAAFLVLLGLLTRHGLWPERWFDPSLYLWMDKWTLGPLRLLNFAAWVTVLLVWKPKFPEWLLLPTALLGRHSLPVFSLHLVLTMVATMLLESFMFPPVSQVLVGVSVVAVLFVWAGWLENHQPWPGVTFALPGREAFNQLNPSRKTGL